ncbi:MAG: helix-turn-helix domain-containing protein [Nitrososphaerales archaeon]
MSYTKSDVYEMPDEDTSGTNNTAASKVQAELVKFGLTPNEAKVYIYLAKYGHRRAVEIAKSIHIPRTETYHLLSSLQNKGLVTATFQHPIKFNAVPFSKALKILIDIEKDRLRTFERKEQDLLSVWESIPDFKMEDDDSTQEKFQILEGQVQVYSRARDMRAKAEQEVIVLGYERDYMKLYHYDFMDGLNEKIEKGVTVKLLTTFSANSLDTIKEINPSVIKHIPDNMNAPLCFVMTDRSELLFFIKNTGVGNKGVLAMWTDCKPFIEAMHILFSELWKNSIAFKDAAKRL